jgi:DNA polymerase III delta prime subunit
MSILITGGTAASRLAEAKKTKALEFDVSTIDQIRELEKFVATGQSVIIKNAQNLTEEAQNAFLKTLEEPPADTTIVLLAPNEDYFLPTILSRCQIIELPPEESTVRDQNQEILQWIEVGDKENGFHWAESIKHREEAIEAIDSLIVASGTKYLRQLLQAKKYLQANTNVRLTLENLFLK